MANTAHILMTSDDFLLWCLDQEDRYELVEGLPVKMMAGASNRHDRLVVNLIVSLGNQLRSTPCRPATADIAVKTKIRSVRRPDVTVTCDPPRADTYDATTAKMIVEVLSPSNRGIAWQRKLEEYFQRAGLVYVLLVEADTAAVRLYSRPTELAAWEPVDVEGLDATIELSGIGCQLTMRDLYDGISFDPA
jgi:Uma2 family endonuclease